MCRDRVTATTAMVDHESGLQRPLFPWNSCPFHIYRVLSRRFAGQVGYIIAGMKDVKEAQIGDTLYLQDQPVEALPGFKPAKPMVFAGRNLPPLQLPVLLTLNCVQTESEAPV